MFQSMNNPYVEYHGTKPATPADDMMWQVCWCTADGRELISVSHKARNCILNDGFWTISRSDGAPVAIYNAAKVLWITAVEVPQ